MNCLDLRRAIGTDPHRLDPVAEQHLRECPRCQEAQQRALMLERRLGAALAISIPDALADRILLAQTTAARHERVRPAWLRYAAGVALAVGAALVAQQALRHPASLPQLAISHLDHEPLALNARTALAGAEVRGLFSALGAPIDDLAIPVHYANDCPLGGRMSAHLVLQRESGPVTALYVPGERLPRQDFVDQDVRGRQAPIGRGTVILLAAESNDFDLIEQSLRTAFGERIDTAVGGP